MSEQQRPKVDNSRLITRLLGSVVLMFAFGFALVPLYEKFCEVTGFNGRTSNTAAALSVEEQIDRSRTVTVEFHTRVGRGMPWEFKSEVRRIALHPGEMKVVNFIASNPTGQHMVGQAIPSVSPSEAAPYLNKTECFCFERQPVSSGETVVMPMQFYLDPDLPSHINQFTLSYIMYDMTSGTINVTAAVNDAAE